MIDLYRTPFKRLVSEFGKQRAIDIFNEGATLLASMQRLQKLAPNGYILVDTISLSCLISTTEVHVNHEDLQEPQP
jgi:hypothetical protein